MTQTKGFIIIRHDEDGPSRFVAGPRGIHYGFDAKGDVQCFGPSRYVGHYAWHEPGTVFSYRQAERIAKRLRRHNRASFVVFKVVGVYTDRYGAQRRVGK